MKLSIGYVHELSHFDKNGNLFSWFSEFFQENVETSSKLTYSLNRQ